MLQRYFRALADLFCKRYRMPPDIPWRW